MCNWGREIRKLALCQKLRKNLNTDWNVLHRHGNPLEEASESYGRIKVNK